MDYGILEFDPRSKKHKILNHKYKVLYDSSRRNKWSPEDYVDYESYLTDENYTNMKTPDMVNITKMILIVLSDF